MINWVRIKKIAELTGYTEEAIRNKRKKGVWRENIHWRKAPDNRLVFNIKAIGQWLEGKAV